MQLIGIVLLLISVGLVVGPVGAVVYIYKDDLSGLIIPPEVKGLVNGDSSLFINDNSGNDGDDSPFGSFVQPEFVSANIDNAARTFSVTVNLTNSFTIDLTLNSLSTDVDTPDRQRITAVGLSNPYVIAPGESALVTVEGSWTQTGEAYFMEHYSTSEAADVVLVNTVVDVNGVSVELSEPIQITVPMSTSGITVTG
ncbi:MAG: hypothetical protein M1540_06135 [Candidatus Bathyarchaeota archaeon]|nr:hypothetical protein [Candidatus Bathyarchaeota archaeon]